ncbi:MAG: Nif11 family protein [Atopobiaceae bacterium]|nr:Nif11 family protein [Atopobiaceae bacterium]
MSFEDLKDPKLQEKLKGAKTPEELLELAREEGVELTNEELDGIASGSFWDRDNFCIDYRGNELDSEPGWN